MPAGDKTNFLNNVRFNFNRRTTAFLACLVLSVLFWLLTSLSREYVEVIQIPVVYHNLPDNQLVVNELANNIDAEVRIFGFDLLWYWIKFETLQIDVDADPETLRSFKRGGDVYHVYLTADQQHNVTAQFDEHFQLLGISPDTLFFKFKPRLYKSVPVLLDAQLSYEKQFGLVGTPSLNPDSVIISGLKEVIDTIDFVRTVPHKLDGLNESVSTTLELQDINGPLLKLSQKEVELELNVVEFTEGKFTTAVEIVGDNSQDIKVYPNTVQVTYMVPLTQYDQVKAEEFRVEVNISGSSWKELSRLNVDVVRKPDEVHQIRVNPAQVEYIIQN